MRRIAKILVVLALVTLPGCPGGCQNPPTGDDVGTCAELEGREIVHTLIPRVNTVIATGPSYETVAVELAKLVGEYGLNVVTCVVAEVQSRQQAAVQVATGDEKDLHDRSVRWAERWIEEEGSDIASSPASGAGSGGAPAQ